MSELRAIGDIQLNEDMAFLRREWRVQRIGWFAMAAVLGLALLGVFGRGPVSRAESGNRNSFGLKYDRITRHGAETALEFYVGAGLQRDSTLKLFLSDDYLRHFSIVDIAPEPTASGASGKLVYYVFTRPNARQPGRIVFQVRPMGYWSHSAIAALQGATAIRFDQFVLP